MSDQLTPARLRELIAAATPGPWGLTHAGSMIHEERGNHLVANYLPYPADSRLIVLLVNHAPALAEALAKVQIYEEALVAIDRGRGGCEETHCWNVAEQALIRAAKEAADAKA